MDTVDNIILDNQRRFEDRQNKINDEHDRQIADIRTVQTETTQQLKSLVDIIPPIVKQQKENNEDILKLHSKIEKTDNEVGFYKKLIIITVGAAGTVVGLITSSSAFDRLLDKIFGNLFK